MPEIDPPWRLDPLQTIVDVHWDQTTLGVTWLCTRTFEEELGDSGICSPVTNTVPDGATLIQAYTTGVTFELVGPFGVPDGATLHGGASVSGSIGGPSSGPFVESGSFEESSHTFNILGRPVTVAEGCYGILETPTGVSALGYIFADEPVEPIGSVSASSSVTGITWNDIEYDVVSVTISSSGIGPRIDVVLAQSSSE